MADADVGYLLDAESIRQLREDHETLSAIVLSPNRRRLITRGGGGGGSPQPFIITQKVGTDPDEENVAVFRWVGDTWTARAPTASARPVTVECKPAKWNENDKIWATPDDEDAVDVRVILMSGVAFTGQVVLVNSIGGDRSIVSGCSSHLFSAVPDDSIGIDVEGVVVLNYMNEAGLLQEAKVEAYNDTGSALVDTDSLAVEFLDAEQRFIISRKGC